MCLRAKGRWKITFPTPEVPIKIFVACPSMVVFKRSLNLTLPIAAFVENVGRHKRTKFRIDNGVVARCKLLSAVQNR